MRGRAGRQAWGHRLKRWLYLTHRWLGIASCLLFAIWFLSGLVMIYVPFPFLTGGERLEGLAPIDWGRVRVAPDAALRAAGQADWPRTLSLEMRGDRPVWRVTPWEGAESVGAADSGRPLGPADAREASATAAAFGHAPVAALTTLDRDQWTVAGSFDRHRPLWKAELAGPGGRVLYVSSRTGAVVLDTDARERFWNWLGSVPHWIYPTILRQDNAVWRQVVMWVSGPCIVAAVAGMWIGILRVRIGRRRFKGGRMTPYRGWMKWHHVAGLIGGAALTTWIFSGWLSVDPFRLFASPGADRAAMTAYASGPGAPSALDVARLARIAPDAKRLGIVAAAGQPLVKLERAGEPAEMLDPRTLTPALIAPARLIAAAAPLVPAGRIARVETLTRPDAYWYDAGDLPTLPVLRLVFDDPAATWVTIDPRGGAILDVQDRRRRLYRWMFDLFHKWDLNVLTRSRPSWDILLWALSLLGLVTSVSGIWLGWKRLRR